MSHGLLSAHSLPGNSCAASATDDSTGYSWVHQDQGNSTDEKSQLLLGFSLWFCVWKLGHAVLPSKFQERDGVELGSGRRTM